MDRLERINNRFKLIQSTVEEMYGERMGQAAASAAIFKAIQYGALQSMKHVADLPESTRATAIELFDKEHELMLRACHKEICSWLGVDPDHAVSLSKNFEQVIRDICEDGG